MACKTAKRKSKRRSRRKTEKGCGGPPASCPRCANIIERLAELYDFDASDAMRKLGTKVTTKASAPKKTGKPRKLSPYICFSQKERSKVLADNPSLEPKNVMKELGKRWRGLSESEKKSYG